MPDKICGKCGDPKDESLFRKRTMKTKVGLQSWCAECMDSNRMKSYYENHDHEIERKKKQRKSNRKENMIRIFAILEESGCVDCGEKDPVVLDFDHLGDKKFTISNRVDQYKWERIAAEIAKCVVRCANCHRRKTAKELGWYKYMEK